MANKELPPLPQIEISEIEFKRSNRRKFFIWMASGLLGAFSIRSLFQAEEDRGVPWPLRKINDVADAFWKSQFKNTPAETRESVVTGKPRFNGGLGLENKIDPTTWRLRIQDPRLPNELSISLEELRRLPTVTETFEFKCIEGWSVWTSFTGVRFSELMTAYKIGTKAVEDSPEDLDGDFYAYASLTSVNGGYYVAMDIKSLMHPQSLLCFEMNAKVLEPENGYPLRLVSSVKYGVKSIKQIGSIRFSDSPPADYWAENGYGEYLGL